MIPACLSFYQKRVNHSLEQLLDSAVPLQRLHDAMRYVVLDGGKRFRAALVYAATDALQGSLYVADNAACSVELVHAYSLVHDDLPALDNDDWRRGKPSCHKQFDEPTAILVGDALQALAFEVLAENVHLSEAQRIQQITSLARAIGQQGMVGGQAIDMTSLGCAMDQPGLENMHQLKTGALIKSCVELGAYSAAHASVEELENLREYARLIGLAFQVIDDVLDVTGTLESLGKKPGADIALGKSTFTSLIGVEKSIEYADSLIEKALIKIEIFGEHGDNLRDLAQFCINRDR